mmetsp:Transcript_7192/g.13202  ORF Transcript_7192/g.13202 Transcript_7192/m.13202 type:complete len:99 (-) Transcript_7192:35-331(-)
MEFSTFLYIRPQISGVSLSKIANYVKDNSTMPDTLLCAYVMTLSDESEEFVTLEKIIPHCTGKCIEEIMWSCHVTKAQIEACVSRFSQVLVSIVHETK